MKISRYQYAATLFVFIINFFVLARPDLTLVKIGTSGIDNGSVRIGDDGFEFNGAALGLNDKSDNVLYAFGTPTGNFDFQTRVSGFVDTSEMSEAGLMVRTDTTAAAAFVSLLILQERGTVIKYRANEGKQLKTVKLSSTIYSFLRIVRIGNVYTFYYKNNLADSWSPVSTTYEFNFPTTLCAGVFHSSTTELDPTISRYTLISGIPQEYVPPTQCQPKLFNFESGEPIDSLGFTDIHYWNLDPGHYIRSSTNGGNTQVAHLISPPFLMSITKDTTTISWDLFAEGTNGALLNDYALFATEGISVLDRSVISGGDIGSPARIQFGIEAKVTGNIVSGKDVFLLDRSGITGNVSAGDTIEMLSNAWVSGSVSEHKVTSFPLIPTKTVSVGSSSITVNPGDTLDVIPGQYNVFHAYADAKLRFRPGVYNFRRFSLEPGVRMHVMVDVNNTVSINVRDTFQMGDRTQMIVIDTNSSRNISIYSHQTCNASLGTNMRLFGYFYFPRAEVIATSRSLLINGGIYARKITIQPDVGVTIGKLNGPVDTLITHFKPSENSTDDYALKFLIHCSVGLDTIKDLFFTKNGLQLASVATIGPTPLSSWLRFSVQFFDENENKRMRLLYNNGTGSRKILDSVPVEANGFSSLSFDYKTNVLPDNRQVRLDNISISCSDNGCHPIIIIQSPVSDSVYVGGTAQFNCSVEAGVNHLVYQWYRNGKPVSWSNNSEFTVQNVNISDNGDSIFCKIAGSCDTIISNTVFLTVLKCTTVVIYAQPESDTVSVNDSVEFKVNASGHELTYQWYKNDHKIDSAINSRHVISSVQTGNNLDEFKVLIGNGCSVPLMSNSAILNVLRTAPCKITVQPKDDTLQEGDYYIGNVDALCDGSVFQWYRNGLQVSGAIEKQLLLGPISRADSGVVITCVVTNGRVADTTYPAILHVIAPRFGSRIISISGELVDGNKYRQAKDTVNAFDFRVCLFSDKTDGIVLYTEYLSGKRAVIVRDGYFTVNLGRGDASGNLQNVIASNKNIYAELSAGQFSNYEIIGSRLPLSSSPYSMSSGVKLIYGDGIPTISSVVAPIGTVYLNKTDSYRMWKMSHTGWVRVD